MLTNAEKPASSFAGTWPEDRDMVHNEKQFVASASVDRLCYAHLHGSKIKTNTHGLWMIME